MPALKSRVLLAAAPALAASFVILALGGVGRGQWISHAGAMGLAVLGAVLGRSQRGSIRGELTARALLVLTILALAAPLLSGDLGPKRWISLGAWSLYVAPLVLPAFLLAWSARTRAQDHGAAVTLGAVITAALLLAAQPDASQVLALLAAVAVVFLGRLPLRLPQFLTLLAMSLATGWAFSRPDPLQPVPHVEEVFALALSRSLPLGLAVITSAVVLVAGLWHCSLKGHRGLAAVATYYAVLFACSVAGLTPAPLLGYGSGPMLGFGLMLAALRSTEPGEPRLSRGTT